MHPVYKVLSAIILAVGLGALGYAIGQEAPFTGLAPMAELYSPIRNDAAQAYAIIAGVFGLLVGLYVQKE